MKFGEIRGRLVGSAGRRRRSLGGSRSLWAAAVCVAVALVVVPAASATMLWSVQPDDDGDPANITATAVDGSTFPAPTEINVPIYMSLGTDIDIAENANEGFKALSFVDRGLDPIADYPAEAESFYLGLDRRCNQEEPWPEYTMVQPSTGLPFSTCWEYQFADDTDGLGHDGGGAFGFGFADVATDGTTPVVFDHWDVTGAAPMGLVPGQTTVGVSGYCTSGDRGYWNLDDPTNGTDTPDTIYQFVSYQSYINPDTGVGMQVNYKAVYMPADPDTTAPEITFPPWLDCSDFEQGASQSVAGTAATIKFFCTDPGATPGYSQYGGVLAPPVPGPTGTKSCTGEVNGTPVHDGDPIDTSVPGDYTLTVTAIDNAGNTRTKSATWHVLAAPDSTPPTVSPVVTGTVGNGGWYTSDVTVAWNVADPESQVTSPPCAGGSVTSDTTGVTFSCTATSAGGTTGPVSVTIKRDATAPTVSFGSHPSSYTVDQTVAISCNATDTTSQVAQQCANVNAPAYTFAVGPNTITGTATDNAGNTGSAKTSFTVNDSPAGVCNLTTHFIHLSNNYIQLTAKQKAVVDALLSVACNNVNTITAKLTAKQKAAAVAAYIAGVNQLKNGGWLTTGQASILTGLAQQL